MSDLQKVKDFVSSRDQIYDVVIITRAGVIRAGEYEKVEFQFNEDTMKIVEGERSISGRVADGSIINAHPASITLRYNDPDNNPVELTINKRVEGVAL